MARAEGAAASSERGPFAAFDDLNEATIVADDRGRIIYANDSCGRVLSRSSGSLLGSELVEMIPSRLRPAHLLAFARCVDEGEGRFAGQPVRVPALRPDGSETPIELMISVVGQPVRAIVATLRPVVAPAEVDVEALLSRAFVDVLSERLDPGEVAHNLLAALGAALMWDAVAFWGTNQAPGQLQCEAWWGGPGLDRFEAASRGALLAPGVDLPGRVWELGQAVWVEGLATDRNFPRCHAATAVALRSGAAFPVAASGRFVGVVECFSRVWRPEDVSLLAVMVGAGGLLGTFLDRDRDEQERSRLLDQVQTERGRLHAVLQQLPLGVMITDVDGEVALSNQVVEELLGPPGSDQRHQIGALPSAIVDEEVALRTPAGAHAVMSVSSVPVHDHQGRTVSRVTTLVDVTGRRAQQARSELLAEAGEILARSVDVDEMLVAIAAVSVRDLTDLCTIDLLDGHRIRRVATAVSEPSKGLVAAQLNDEYAPDLDGSGGIPTVLRTGQPIVQLDLTDDHLRARAVDETHLASLRELGLRSVVIVPLISRARTLGALTYASLSADHPLGDEEVELIAELGRRTGLAIANARLHEDARQVSHALQSGLLPPVLPAVPGLDLGASFMAGREGMIVGGDFYDVFPLDDGQWAVTIGDVCGTGAEAAALMAHVRYTARAAQERGHPAALLRRLNASLRDADDGSGRFCTVVHGRLLIEPDRVVATLASGGHPPPLILRREGGVEEVRCQGTLLGLFDEVLQVEAEVVLSHGDSLVLFTDGVTEARGATGMFGSDGLHRVLVEMAGSTAGEVSKAVSDAVLRHGNGHSSDDVAVLVVRAQLDPSRPR